MNGRQIGRVEIDAMGGKLGVENVVTRLLEKVNMVLRRNVMSYRIGEVSVDWKYIRSRKRTKYQNNVLMKTYSIV